MRTKLSDNYHLGFIGNGRSAALIDITGDLVYACLPDFDGGSAFARLLDDEKGGHFGLRMIGGAAVNQYYEEDTNVLVTEFRGKTGAFRVIDFMPRYRAGDEGGEPYCPQDIVRVLEPLDGTPRIQIEYEPALEYGMFPTITSEIRPGIFKSTTRGKRGRDEIYESIYLYTEIPSQSVLEGKTFSLTNKEHLLVSYNDKVTHPCKSTIRLMLTRTRAYWLAWAYQTALPSQYREEVLRSALTLKQMQFAPTGAMVASPTTSLPETIGEERNWDYRYCWLRDASMTVSVCNRLGHPDMANKFVQWLLDIVPTKDDPLQIMYGIRGEKRLTEYQLDHLSGYQGSKPVRIGNAAYSQKQHDIYGAVLDVFWLQLDHFLERPDELDAIWTRVRSVARTVESLWNKPDRGIWEFRGKPQHFLFSKLLCWVAIDRACKIARRLNRPNWADTHAEIAEAIRADIYKRGWSDKLGGFAQRYGSDDADASNMLMASYGFIEPDDPKFISTVETTWASLGFGPGLLMRYKNRDDFGVPHSAFTICCFWGVKALAQIGKVDEARKHFEQLLSDANHLGLLSEDLHIKTRRQLGNFPQAYSHLALIDAALELDKKSVVD